MQENDLLREKFRAKGFEMISEFIRRTDSEITQESWGKVLKRNKPVSVELWLRMAGELGCTPEEIKGVMLARGEKVLAELIAPASMSIEDRKFLNRLHELNGDPKKLKLVNDLLDNLKG